MAGKPITVKGKEEVKRAFNKVKDETEDLSDTHKKEAEMLLPDVRSATRKRDGHLVAGWQTDSIATEAQFLNEVVYAGVQEWGWSARNIDPTHAIIQAFEKNEKQTEALYGDAIGDIGRKAGFETKD